MTIQLNNDLDHLESEAIWAIRETLGAFDNPVLLYSIGKDSTVLLHLAMKAVAPTSLTIPVLHIDTTWKFNEMISFREEVAEKFNLNLIVHTNHDGLNGQITPFTHTADEYTRLMKTVALRQALDVHKFDAAIGGARRDEEVSRAKERMFSLREPGHAWNPKQQRPEFWRTVNPNLRGGQSMRVFPLSNWTELDIWRYIKRENINVVPLYFTKSRQTVDRNKKIIVVDDQRFPLMPGEIPQERKVRFRTLGCYPLSAAEESQALSVDDIITELQNTSYSERAGRLIDGKGSSSMESKKIEGYF